MYVVRRKMIGARRGEEKEDRCWRKKMRAGGRNEKEMCGGSD